MGIDIAEQPWNKDRGEDKDQGAGPKSELVPEISQERPIVRRDARTAERANRQSGGQHGHDTRYMKPALGEDQSAAPTAGVEINVATIASSRIGAASSSIRLTSVAIPASNTSKGRKT